MAENEAENPQENPIDADGRVGEEVIGAILTDDNAAARQDGEQLDDDREYEWPDENSVYRPFGITDSDDLQSEIYAGENAVSASTFTTI